MLLVLVLLGRGLYHSHPESANAKSRAFISEAQNEESLLEEGRRRKVEAAFEAEPSRDGFLASGTCGHAGLT